MRPPADPQLLLLALLTATSSCGGTAPPGEAGRDPAVDGAVAAPAVDPAATDTLLPVNGTRLYVHREGAGVPIIVVHGGPVLDHGYLVDPLRPLAAGRQLVFYDQRLSGRSDGTVDSASVTLATFVADIEALRSALGLGRIHLLGHSWGGLLAMKYAVAHPDRLRSLVLVSPLPPSATLWQEEQRAQRSAITPADTAGLGALRGSPEVQAREPAALERLLQLSFRSQLVDPALAQRLRFHIEDDYGERSRQFGLLGAELGSYDLLDALSGIDVPTLLIYGGAEVGGPIGGDTLAATLPSVTRVTLPGAAHFSFLERPDRFLTVVDRFLTARESGSATR